MLYYEVDTTTTGTPDRSRGGYDAYHYLLQAPPSIRGSVFGKEDEYEEAFDFQPDAVRGGIHIQPKDLQLGPDERLCRSCNTVLACREADMGDLCADCAENEV